MGVDRGDPYRLLAGTDVAGNVCGRSNDLIKDVSFSGQSLKSKPYLYYDWVRTAKILGEDSLTTVLTSLNIVGNFTTVLNGLNYDSNTIARDFCVKDAYKTTSKLIKDNSGGVVSLDESNFQYFKDSKMPVEMKGVVISKHILKNDTAVVALLQKDGSIKVWKTSKGKNKIVLNFF